ncbi:hypothetical protein F4703DRAFT_1097545 [Phycomyces blakesleeanus]
MVTSPVIEKRAPQASPEKRTLSISPPRGDESVESSEPVSVAVPLTIAQLMSKLAAAPSEATAKLLAEALQRAHWKMDIDSAINPEETAIQPETWEKTPISDHIASPPHASQSSQPSSLQTHEEYDYDGPKTPPIEDDEDENDDHNGGDYDDIEGQGAHTMQIEMQTEAQNQENKHVNQCYKNEFGNQESSIRRNQREFENSPQQNHTTGHLEANSENYIEAHGSRIKHEEDDQAIIPMEIDNDGPKTPPYLPEDDDEEDAENVEHEEQHHIQNTYKEYPAHPSSASYGVVENNGVHGLTHPQEQNVIEKDRNHSQLLDTSIQEQPIQPSDADILAKWTPMYPKTAAPVEKDTRTSWLDLPQFQGRPKEPAGSSILSPSSQLRTSSSLSPSYASSFSKQIESFVESCFERNASDSPKPYPIYPGIDTLGIQSHLRMSPSVQQSSPTKDVDASVIPEPPIAAIPSSSISSSRTNNNISSTSGTRSTRGISGISGIRGISGINGIGGNSGISGTSGSNTLDQSALLLEPLILPESTTTDIDNHRQKNSELPPTGPRAFLKRGALQTPIVPEQFHKASSKRLPGKKNAQRVVRMLREDAGSIPKNYPFFDPSLERGTICIVSRTVFVRPLATTTSKEDLRKAMEKYGVVTSLTTVKAKGTIISGFVRYSRREEAVKAVNSKVETGPNGEKVKLSWARTFGPSRGVVDATNGISIVELENVQRDEMHALRNSDIGGFGTHIVRDQYVVEEPETNYIYKGPHNTEPPSSLRSRLGRINRSRSRSRSRSTNRSTSTNRSRNRSRSTSRDIIADTSPNINISRTRSRVRACSPSSQPREGLSDKLEYNRNLSSERYLMHSPNSYHSRDRSPPSSYGVRSMRRSRSPRSRSPRRRPRSRSPRSRSPRRRPPRRRPISPYYEKNPIKKPVN